MTSGNRPARLSPELLAGILDQYNLPALKKMAQSRGLVPEKSKAGLITLLAHNFYDQESIAQAFARLSPPARLALALLKRLGGEAYYYGFRYQLQARWPQTDALPLVNELAGSGLVFFATLANEKSLNFYSERKHELDQPGFLAGQALLWLDPHLAISLPTDSALAAELKPVTLSSYQGAEPGVAVAASYTNFLADFLSLIRYLEENRVKLLKSGSLGKRDYTRIVGLMSVKDKIDPGAVEEFAELERTYFLWELLWAGQFLAMEEESGRVRVVKEVREAFFQLKVAQQVRHLATAWVKLLIDEFPRIPTLEFVYMPAYFSDSRPDLERQQYGRLLLLQRFQEAWSEKRMSEEGWLDFKALLLLLKQEDFEFLIPRSPAKGTYYPGYGGSYGSEYYNGFISSLKPSSNPGIPFNYYNPDKSRALSLQNDWDLVEGEWVARIIGVELAWLGLAELGVIAGRGVAFRFTLAGLAMLRGEESAAEKALGRQIEELAATVPELARPLVVQPNFEVLVMAPLQYLPLVNRLEQLAERVSMGEVAVYQMSRESVQKGLRAGLAGDAILALLKENSRMPVPENVELSLRDWWRSYERLTLRQKATILEVADPQQLDRLEAEPGVIIRRYSPTIALVNPEKLAGLPVGVRKIDLEKAEEGKLSFKDPYTLRLESNHPYLLYRLGQFCETKGPQEFELTTAGASRAKEIPLKAEAVLDFLASQLASKTSLPAETVVAIKSRLGAYRPLKATPVMALAAETYEQLNELFQVPRFKKLLVTLAGPTLALVRAEGYAELKAALEGIGLPPEEGHPVDTGVEPEKRGKGPLEQKIDELAQQLRNSTPRERQSVVEELVRLGEAVIKPALELLEDPLPQVRYNICLVLGQVGDKKVIPALRKLKWDSGRTKSGTVGRAAIEAIEAIKSRPG